MAVLITGGTGFLGSAVSSRIPQALTPSRPELDLSDGRAVMDYFAYHRPRTVIHLAARVGGILANMEQPADFLIDNVRLDGNILAAVRDYRPDHFLPVLSTCMYPDQLPDDAYPMAEAQIEEGPPPPTNASYAAAKRALWHGTKALGSQHGIGFTALVPANLYGPGDHFGSKYSHFLAAAVARTEAARNRGAATVEYLGTGRARRQYLYVDDVAELIAVLCEDGPVNETLNVAPRQDLSIYELAHAVARVAGYSGTVVFSGEGPDGQLRKDVDPARLTATVPAWSTHIERSLEDGLRETIRWYREHVAAG